MLTIHLTQKVPYLIYIYKLKPVHSVSMPDLLEKIDVMISETSETETILELASKLAIYAAENARKRQRQRKDEIGKSLF